MKNAELAKLLDEAARRGDAGKPPFDDTMAERIMREVILTAARGFSDGLSKVYGKSTKGCEVYGISTTDAVVEGAHDVWRHLTEERQQKPAADEVAEDDEAAEDETPLIQAVPVAAGPRWREALKLGDSRAPYFRTMVRNHFYKVVIGWTSKKKIRERLRSLVRSLGKDSAKYKLTLFQYKGKGGKVESGFGRPGTTVSVPRELTEQEKSALMKWGGEREFDGFPEAADCAQMLERLFDACPPDVPLNLESLTLDDAADLLARIWRLPHYVLPPAEPAKSDESEDYEPIDPPGGLETRVVLDVIELWLCYTSVLKKKLEELDGHTLPHCPPKPGIPHDETCPYGSADGGFRLWWKLDYGADGRQSFEYKHAYELTRVAVSTLQGRVAKIETEVLPAVVNNVGLDEHDIEFRGELLLDYLRFRFAAWKPPGVVWEWKPPAWLEAALHEAGNPQPRPLKEGGKQDL